MKPQFSNQVVSSAYLWLDHLLCDDGAAFYNLNSNLYNITNRYSNFYTYALPYNSIISDTSVPSSYGVSGVYVNNNYTPVGSGGLFAINFNAGQAYFTTQPAGTVSGNFSVKEFNIRLTNKPEETIIFETKHFLRPKTLMGYTGLNNEISYPVIYIKESSSNNRPFSMGGEDITTSNLRLLVFADSQFNLDAVNSLIRDQTFSYIPLITEAEMPFNSLGYYKSGAIYNYDNLSTNKVTNGSGLFIEDIYISKFNQNSYSSEMKTLNPEVFMGVIDIEVNYPRFVRTYTYPSGTSISISEFTRTMEDGDYRITEEGDTRITED